MQIPKQDKFYWLFADTVKGLYQFADFIPEFETRNNNKIPVFVVSGIDTDGRTGDFLIALWNIKNLEELKKQIGDDSDTWKGKLFDIVPTEDKKLKMVLKA